MVDAPLEEVLEIHDIQGNILAGFNKDYQTLLFLNILDVTSAKAWLRFIVPYISTVEEVLLYNRLFKTLRTRLGTDPAGIAATWVNIAFSFRALKQLLPSEQDGPEQFADDAFRNGMVSNSAFLGDPQDVRDVGHPRNWVVGGQDSNKRDTVPDIILIVASDVPQFLSERVNLIKASIAALPNSTQTSSGLELVFEQQGMARAEQPGHEHFGFKDGVSQPSIRGRLSDAPQDFLTPRLIDPAKNPNEARKFARPGQPLVFPGQFVFGYGLQQNNNPVIPVHKDDAPTWARNGSYLVFRRLRQDVKAFQDFARRQAALLAAKPAFSTMTPELLTTKMVGRWPSGTPIIRTPTEDNAAMGKNELANNNFSFLNSHAKPIALLPGQAGDPFPAQTQGDFFGTICPFAAHIRKVNPRDDDTDTGGENDTLTRRILRRGIAFGTSYVEGASSGSPGAADAAFPNDRGLLFLSYQTSISDQFQFLCQNWVNAPNKPIPRGESGQDPVLGQNPSPPTANRDRTFILQRNPPPPESIPLPASETSWIIPTGGGYFFAPSISTLKDVLGKE